jgi:PPOX class probable F420-dependent enzyme
MRVKLDTTTEFGRRVARRLREELIAWLVTVRPDQTPQPVPIWFLWDGQTFLVYSQPDTQKLRNIARSPRVALHLDGNGTGGDIVVLTGEARVVTDAPPANEIPAYVEKYRQGMTGIGMTPESFARAYSVALRVTPTRLQGH